MKKLLLLSLMATIAFAVACTPQQTLEDDSEALLDLLDEAANEQEDQEEEQSSLSFNYCIDSLFRNGSASYDHWKSLFASLFPNLKVYGAGAYCELSDGTQLVSFSHFDNESDGLYGVELMEHGGQTIVLFDENDNMLKHTEDFYCRTMGDLGHPTFQSIENNVITMSCKSGDGGYSQESIWTLDLETFKYEHVESISTP